MSTTHNPADDQMRPHGYWLQISSKALYLVYHLQFCLKAFLDIYCPLVMRSVKFIKKCIKLPPIHQDHQNYSVNFENYHYAVFTE